MVFPNGLLRQKRGSSKTRLPDQILTRCLLGKKSGLLGSLGLVGKGWLWWQPAPTLFVVCQWNWSCSFPFGTIWEALGWIPPPGWKLHTIPNHSGCIASWHLSWKLRLGGHLVLEVLLPWLSGMPQCGCWTGKGNLHGIKGREKKMESRVVKKRLSQEKKMVLLSCSQ